MKLVTVSLVTWNSIEYLPFCLKFLRQQECVKYELIVTDNDSRDGTLDYLDQQPNLTVIRNKKNVGFCKAHNAAISMASGKYILVLNPDVFLMPNFLHQAVCAIEQNDKIGQVSGKLYQISDITEVGISRILDSTGMFFTSNQRHFDRGAGEIDVGQYDRQEYIFAVSGAAAFYRKTALENVAVDGEYFDSRFFAYREDADLSWRMQLMGWKSLYTPHAHAYHVRSVRKHSHRSEIDANVNMHSVKNRFLMRIKNQTWKNSLRFLFPTLWRDLLVVGYVVLFERSSLPAFWSLFKLYSETLHKRRLIMKNRQVSDAYISQWFRQKAVLFDSGKNE
jgi:GT2 family glycosyltransferase